MAHRGEQNATVDALPAGDRGYGQPLVSPRVVGRGAARSSRSRQRGGRGGPRVQVGCNWRLGGVPPGSGLGMGR